MRAIAVNGQVFVWKLPTFFKRFFDDCLQFLTCMTIKLTLEACLPLTHEQVKIVRKLAKQNELVHNHSFANVPFSCKVSFKVYWFR